MAIRNNSKIVQLAAYNVKKGESSISGLSSGVFMTVQLHLAHSSRFAGALSHSSCRNSEHVTPARLRAPHAHSCICAMIS
jgi:hypothetical protein